MASASPFGVKEDSPGDVCQKQPPQVEELYLRHFRAMEAGLTCGRWWEVGELQGQVGIKAETYILYIYILYIYIYRMG